MNAERRNGAREPIRLSDHFSYGRLIRFTMPTIIMMIFTSIYSVVDGLFVSNAVGKTEFAALNFIFPFIMVLGGAGFMIGTGGTAQVAQQLGRGNKEKANRYFSMMVCFTVLLGILLAAIGIAVIRPVCVLLGATPEMMEGCVLYGRIVIAFTPAFMLQNVFQSFLAAAEKPKLGLCDSRSRPDQCRVGRSVYRGLPVGAGRRGAGHRPWTSGGRCAATDLLPTPE